MQQIIIILACFLMSSALFIFWVAKGGFNRKYLYTDNLMLGAAASLLSLLVHYLIPVPFWLLVPFLSGFIILVLFVLLFLYRFFRNPARKVPGDANDVVSAADGRVIYIKELEKGQMPVTVKKMRIAELSEITKTDLLERPCYLIGIAMTLFDVHMNRAPVDGKITFIKHTPGTAIGLNTPSSTVTNERNTVIIERNDGLRAGIVQIAARGVRRCIVMANEGDSVKRGEIIGKIRWGSQLDMIIPRNCEIKVREGEQVYAGSTVIARLITNRNEGEEK
ncbi:MAG: phosphatidylserine decarboxylase [Bacteroidota bacterium]|jgi:phosphatidylserine decarboxylase|nr:phosphatidylserine decarboxylase [Bacteroidota bacterium]